MTNKSIREATEWTRSKAWASTNGLENKYIRDSSEMTSGKAMVSSIKLTNWENKLI